MKVLHVYKTYYPDTLGGIEQVLLQLTQGLAGQGVENRVFALSHDPRPAVIERPEARVVRCGATLELASTPVSWRAFSEFRAQLRWADVVHYQFPWPFADLLHLSTRLRRASVVTYQSDVVRQKGLLTLYRPLMQHFLGSVDRVVATSPNYLSSSPVLASLQRPIDVIANGLSNDGAPHPDPVRRQHWRDQLGADFFFFVGVLRYYKGLHTLVQAARHTRHKVVIAGDGPERRALEKQVAESGLGHVVFVGAVSDEDKAALFSLSLAFVFPSHLRSEAFGMSLVEAASHAKPMITCDIGTGTTFVNLPGQTGLAVPPEQPVALAHAMEALAAHPAEAARMGRAARARFEQLFTADAMATSYLALYTSLLSQPRG